MRIQYWIGVATLMVALMCGSISAQISGTKTIGVDYATINAALLALNASGVGSGGVTINVPAGWTEAAPVGGDTLGSTVLNATTSVSNPIIIQKSGAGVNPLITASVGTSATVDGIFKLKGVDYVTIDGIDLVDTNTVSATTKMEWGYALVKLQNVAPFDGCQHVTIRNCTVTLSRTNATSVGIYANNHIATATTTLSITAVTDANSYNSIYSNTINNCYSGISISGNSTYQDLNNYIGVGGGNTITNFGGSSSTAYGITTTYQDGVKIDNNSVTGGNASQTTTIYGIYPSSGLYASGEINGNTVSVTCASSGAAYALRCGMGSSGTTNTITMSGNTVQNCALTTTSGSFYGIYLTASAATIVVSSNTISNCSIPSAGTGSINGIFFQNTASSVPTALTVSNNTIANLSGGTSTSNYVYGIYLTYSSALNGTVSMYGNTIHGLAAYSMNACGLRYTNNFANGSITKIYQNNIYDIVDSVGSSTSLFGVSGFLYATNTNVAPIYTYAYNNFISDLRSPAAVSVPNATGYSGLNQPYSVTGMVATQGSGSLGCFFSAFDNTVYLNASSTGATFGTCGILATSNLTTDLRNNIVVNTSSPGSTGGACVANGRIDYSSTSYSRPGLVTYQSTSNNNDFYVNGSARCYIYGDSTSIANSTADVTMGAYKTRMDPRELQSFSENPPFVSVATHDLRIQTGVPTQVESGGTPVTSPIAITTDYYGTTRNASYPDVGAEEFGGIISDHTSPAINYTAFNTVSPTAAHTLAATITDPSGVPTGGSGLPVLYYKVNAGGTYISAPATSTGGSQYSFSFTPAAGAGDTVFYYVAAQDGAGTPNVGTMEYTGASGLTANPPAASTPPTNPYWYRIVAAPLSGSYTVGGTSPDFATVSAAVAALNTRGAGGSVTFLLNTATPFNEGAPVVIKVTSDSIPTASKTVTIKPNTGITATVTGSYTKEGTFDIYSSYIIIDGNNGDGTRSLTIANTNTAADTTYVVGFISGGGKYTPTNCTVQNCNIAGNSSNLNTAGNSTPVGFYLKPGSGYNNITINNNQVTKVQTGIWYFGTSGSYAANGQITNNIIGHPTTDVLSVFRQGVSMSWADNTLISGNEFIGEVAGNSNSGANVLSNNLAIYVTSSTNTKIRKNKIHDYTYNFNPVSPAAGSTQGIAIDLNNGTAINTGTTEISNNMIYNIKACGSVDNAGTSTFGGVPQGIAINGNGTSTIQIYYNTVYLSGNVLGNTGRGYAANGNSACIGFNASFVGAGTIDMRNNIFKNTQKLAPTDSTTAANVNETLAIFLQKSGTAAIFSNSDYNNYDVTGNSPQIGYAAVVAGVGNDYPTLSGWQGVTGKDVHSATDVVTCVSTSNPHLSGGSVGDLMLAGTPIAGITTDIDGDTRDGSAPYMGADEGTTPLPIQLSSFTGTLQSNGVRLSWTTLSEVNNFGFYVQRKRSSDTTWIELPNGFIAGHGTTNQPHSYSFSDNTVPTSPVQYRLRQTDLDGRSHFTDPVEILGVTGVKETAPRVFALLQNYPNPFNPSTEIKFSVETTGKATLEIFNLLGQRVMTLFNDVAEAGQYYRVRLNGSNLASGIYFYHLASGTRSDLKKMIMLK